MGPRNPRCLSQSMDLAKLLLLLRTEDHAAGARSTPALTKDQAEECLWASLSSSQLGDRMFLHHTWVWLVAEQLSE